MDKAWVERKTLEQKQTANRIKEEIRKKIIAAGFESDLESIMKEAENCAKHGFTLILDDRAFKNAKKKSLENQKKFSEWLEAYCELQHSLKEDMEKLMECRRDYSAYLDSDPVAFDGDIIITDPCYIIRRNYRDDEREDNWELCEYGDSMEKLGLTHTMVRDTIYGDWSCTTYNAKGKKKIGSFCADSGMVCVLDLQEVLRYNPEFDYHKERDWTTTLIRNFQGTVQFVVSEEHYQYNGKDCVDYNVSVVGKGINKRSKKPFEFYTRQTGF